MAIEEAIILLDSHAQCYVYSEVTVCYDFVLDWYFRKIKLNFRSDFTMSKNHAEQTE